MAPFASSFLERLAAGQRPDFQADDLLTLRVGSWSREYRVAGEREGLLMLDALPGEPDGPVHAAKLVMGEAATDAGLAEFGIKVVSSMGDCLMVAPGTARIRERRIADRNQYSPPLSGLLDGRPCLLYDCSRGGAKVLTDGRFAPGTQVDVACPTWTGEAWVLACRQTPAGFELRVVRMAS